MDSCISIIDYCWPKKLKPSLFVTIISMKYEGDDFYCDVAIPKLVDLDIEYESDNVLAYQHTKPFWPVHVVIVPKMHIAHYLL